MSRAVAQLTGASIGGQVAVRELGPRTVVGIVEDPLLLDARIVLAPPSFAADAVVRSNDAQWLVGLPPGSDADAVARRLSGATVPGTEPSTGPLFTVRTRVQAIHEGSSVGPTTIVLGGLALADAALVAAAAFAVGIRRRQRELGLLAAAGATPRQLAASVLAEALLLGAIGAALGAAVGIGGALLLSPFLEAFTNHRNPPLVLDVPVLAVAVAMGGFAALLAALAPAWSASRMPVLRALSGRRPPVRSAGRVLAAGLVTVGFAISLTVLGAALRLKDAGTLSLVLLLGGAVLGTLGFGACSPWLLERLDLPRIGLPPATRIALRDTARARSRNAPIVAALLAAAAGTVALSAYAASLNAEYLARWRPFLHPNQMMLVGPGFALAGPEAARQVKAVAAAPIEGAAGPDERIWVGTDKSGSHGTSTAWIAVGTPELLAALALESAAADLEAGRIVFLWPSAREGEAVVDDPPVVNEATIHVVSRTSGDESRHLTVPAGIIASGVSADELPGALIPQATVAQLGLARAQVDSMPAERFVIRLDHPVTDGDLAVARRAAAGYPDTTALVSRPPDVAGGLFRIVLIAVSLIFSLTVTGIAVALGEAESRPDQRTLLAVGADPRLGRRITATRAAIIATLGGVLAVPAGLLPVWGLLATRGASLVVPVPEIIAIVAALPVLAVVAAWLLGRPIAPWSVFRDGA